LLSSKQREKHQTLWVLLRPKPGNPTPAISRLQAWQTASPAVFLGSHLAEHYTRDLEKALAAADKLKTAELRSNIVKLGPHYAADLLKLAERDEIIKKAIVQYLAEKVKNSTPIQREIAAKSYKCTIF
jgi:hypothetical protein